jgi:hypothetical protein
MTYPKNEKVKDTTFELALDSTFHMKTLSEV